MDPVTQFVLDHKIPLGEWGRLFFAQLIDHTGPFLRIISSNLDNWLKQATSGLAMIPAPIFILCLAAFGYYVRRSYKLTLALIVGFLLILNLGLWNKMLETLVLVTTAAAFSMLIGTPIGIWSAHHPRFYRILQPLLDLMQTLPTFVYLIPILAMFGLGNAPGLIVTIIFVIPSSIRLTHLGIASVPKTLLETGIAFGASPQQLLWKIELPAAMPTLMAALTQSIMLSLSMVVFASLIGAGGLGTEISRALHAGPRGLAMGLEAGLAVVVLAILLDRLCQIRK